MWQKIEISDKLTQAFYAKKEERKNDDERFSAISKRIKREKSKIRSELNQQRGNIIPDTFASEENFIDHDINNTKKHELRDELSYQKSINQAFLFKGKIDLVGKIVETNIPFKDIGTFENYLEHIDEHYDEGSLVVQGADIFVETHKKTFKKVKESAHGKGTKKIIERWLNITVEIVKHQAHE